jgi:hypothetical protein
MSDALGIVEQFVQGLRTGKYSPEDVDAFFQNPRLWRKPVVPTVPFTPESAQKFWQGVWNELWIEEVEVPPVPKLTDKQVKSLDKFGFLLVYVPAITEEQFPKGFVKPKWGQYLTEKDIERLPLTGQWVAVETIAKPHYDDSTGYADDVLMASVKCEKRFNVSHDDLTGGLLGKIAKVTGFPKKGTRLPSAEEWNLIGNLFNWLREHRQLSLPDLGSTRSWEWCANACGSGGRLVAGDSDYGGLADVGCGWHGHRRDNVAFRVLAVL